jgi:hypothetical protein
MADISLPFSSATLPTIGNTDYVGYTQGTYFYTDCLGDVPVFISTTGSGAAGYGLVTPAGAPALTGGYSAGTMNGRLGALWAYGTALNDVGSAVMGGGAGTNFIGIFPSSPTITFNLEICTPPVLSNATDRYQVYYGWFYGVAANPVIGWTIGYSDNVNSGNWVLQEWINSTPTTLASSSVAVVANTWNRVSLTVSGNAVTCTIQPSGGALSIIASNVNSARLNGGNPMAVQLGGVWMKRTAFVSGSIGALIDSASVVFQGATRT